MHSSVHKMTLSFSILLFFAGGSLALLEVSKMPQTKSAIAPTIPEDSEVTDISVNGSRWALVKLWDVDKSKGLEVYNPTIRPSVDLGVIKDRIVNEGNVTGFILEQKTMKGETVWGWAYLADTPSTNPKDYRLIPVTRKWVEQNPELFDKLRPQNRQGKL